MGALGGRGYRVRAYQAGPLPGRVRHGHRVVHGHDRALGGEPIADFQAGGLPEVVAVGLERDAEHRHPLAVQRAACGVARQLDDPVPAAQVDAVHRGQQADQRVDAQVRRAGPERADVLRQAAAAVPEPGGQEPPADARVVAERLGQRHHVGARLLADLGHGVDERDLGREERVRRHLNQLGRLQVHHEQRGSRRQRRGVHPAHQVLRPAGRHAEHDPVRGQAVGNREPFPQELRVPGHLDRRARRSGRLYAPGDLPRGPDRDGRLAHDQAGRRQVRSQRIGRRVDEAEIRLAGRALGRPHAQEVDLAELPYLGK